MSIIIYYFITSSVASVAFASKVRASAMLLLRIMGYVVYFRYISVNNLHKDKDDDDNNNITQYI